MSYSRSDHYNGKKFFNQNLEARAEKDARDLVQWMRTRKKVKWPAFTRGRLNAKLPQKLESGQAVVTFINHATSLIQIKGVNILTDPVFSNRVSPFSRLGPHRVREPGLYLSELPKIDFILLSHNHYDHLDIHALNELVKKHNPQIVCPLGNKKYFLKRKILNVVEMDWWQCHQVKENLHFHLTPAQHWSSRSPFDRNTTLWGGFIIESFDLKIFFAGDTGYYSHFDQIYQKFGAIDISLLPIGSYEPQWFMKAQHMNPREALKAHVDLHSRMSIGIHFGCFQLADEGIHEPASDLRFAMSELGMPTHEFYVPDHGESFSYQK